MKQLFSVIIPVYNARNWLCPCLDSICSQTFQYWEAILIDDGSTDGSQKICDDYAQIDHRFRVVHQTNKGVSVARNVGVCMATGNYVLFVDADDMLLPEALQVLAKSVEKHPECELFQFGYQEEGKIYCAEKSFLGTVEAFFSNGFLPLRTVWGTLFRRELVEKIEFTKGLPVGEDTEYSAQCYFLAKHISVIPEALYMYRKDIASVMHSRITSEKIRSILTVIRHLSLDLVPEFESANRAKQRLLEQLRMSFYQMLYKTRDERNELLAEYRRLNLSAAKHIYALRVADAFPWLYFFIIKYIRHIPQ